MTQALTDPGDNIINNYMAATVDDPDEHRIYSDRVFSQWVDQIGQTDAAILACASMAMCTRLNFLFQRYGLYDNTGRLPFSFKRLVGYDLLLIAVPK